MDAHIRDDFLPPFRHNIGEEEIKEVIDTLSSDWITTGPKTKHFEETFRNFLGCKNAVAVNSCTAGLHLSLTAFGIGSGDEVITSPYTFASTANVVIHQGAVPVFCDVQPDTLNIDPENLEEKITEKTKAIIPVHYAGHPCDMDEILKIAQENGLSVIEDAAHAFGAVYKDRPIGTIGNVTAFSFYATKNITTAEGGMVTTNDAGLAERIRILSMHGISKDAWKRYSSKGSWFYEVLDAGYKYNMTDLQASIGIHQIKKADAMLKRRQEIAESYNEAFKDLSEVMVPVTKNYVTHAWHLYPIRLNTELLAIDRDKFIEIMHSKNIGTSVHFIPLHLHPFYRDRYNLKQGEFPNAEHAYSREVSLPVYPRMADDDVKDVIESVKDIIKNNKK